MLVMIAGKFSAGDTDYNIRVAKCHAELLWKEGYVVYTPHLNTDFNNNLEIPYEKYIEISFRIMPICDVLYLLPGWEESPGALREVERASELNIPIAHCLKELRQIKEQFYQEDTMRALRTFDRIYAKGRQDIVNNHKRR